MFGAVTLAEDHVINHGPRQTYAPPTSLHVSRYQLGDNTGCLSGGLVMPFQMLVDGCDTAKLGNSEMRQMCIKLHWKWSLSAFQSGLRGNDTTPYFSFDDKIKWKSEKYISLRSKDVNNLTEKLNICGTVKPSSPNSLTRAESSLQGHRHYYSWQNRASAAFPGVKHVIILKNRHRKGAGRLPLVEILECANEEGLIEIFHGGSWSKCQSCRDIAYGGR